MSDEMPDPVPDNLMDLLIEWINTDTWDESQEILRANAEQLLSDEALEALDKLLAESVGEDGEDERKTLVLQQHRAILEKARADSIDAAYAELLQSSPPLIDLQSLPDELLDAIQAMIKANSSTELLEQIRQHPILLTPQATAAIDHLLETLHEANEDEAISHIDARYDTLKQVIEANQNPVNIALNALMQATSSKLQQTITQHPILLDDETLQAFDELVIRAEQAGDTGLAQRLHLRLEEVRRMRKEREQTARHSHPGAVDHAELEQVEIRAERGSIAFRDSYGSVELINIETAELAPPPQKWQPPGAPSLPKTFIGRQKELQELRDYLIAGEDVTISGTPMATMLQGMGGIGKTYLATRLAIEVQAHFPGGVITVILGERVTSEEEAQDALGELASYAFGGHKPQFVKRLQPQQVAASLQTTSPGRLLVIFDDVWDQEPLLFLERALPADAVRVVTTRDANIAWAHSGKRISLDRLTVEDGVALLEARLGWRGDMAYRGSLEKLVTELEGHALSLDIIAARIKEPERLQEILDGLTQGIGQARLDQLKLRGKQTRETSLERSLALSYDYMTGEEKRRFRMLGVFEAGTAISVEAAAAVWGMDDLNAAKKALFDLVDLAMLEKFAGAYRQHSLLGAYAYALLDREGELNGASWAHAEYYRSLAWRAETATPKDYPLLDQHIQNLKAALEWSDKYESLLFSQLVEVLFQFLQLRGESKKLEVYLPKAITIAAATGSPGRQANLLQSLGDLERRLGNIDQARAHYDAALPLYRLERDRLGEANLLMSLADMFLAQKLWTQARAYYEQALPKFVAERDPLGQANTLIDLGLVRFELGDQERGMYDIQQAAMLFRTVQDEVWAHRAELRLAEMRARLEQPGEGGALFEAFLTVQSPQEMFQLAQQHPQLLTDAWLATVEALITSQEDEQVKGDFSQRLDTLRQIRQALEDNAVEVSKATGAVIDFAQADWNTRRQMLTEHANVLLSKDIEPLFDALLAANEDASARHALEDVRTLLQRCRTWGIGPAWHLAVYMRLGDAIDIPIEHESAVMQAATLLSRQVEDKTALDQAIKAMETLLEGLTSGTPPLFKAALQRDLAETMHAFTPCVVMVPPLPGCNVTWRKRCMPCLPITLHGNWIKSKRTIEKHCPSIKLLTDRSVWPLSSVR